MRYCSPGDVELKFMSGGRIVLLGKYSFPVLSAHSNDKYL